MVASYIIRRCIDGSYVLTFLIDGMVDNTAYRTNGTGCRVYDTYDKALSSGRRYLERMRRNGFLVKEEW